MSLLGHGVVPLGLGLAAALGQAQASAAIAAIDDEDAHAVGSFINDASIINGAGDRAEDTEIDFDEVFLSQLDSPVFEARLAANPLVLAQISQVSQVSQISQVRS